MDAAGAQEIHSVLCEGTRRREIVSYNIIKRLLQMPCQEGKMAAKKRKKKISTVSSVQPALSAAGPEGTAAGPAAADRDSAIPAANAQERMLHDGQTWWMRNRFIILAFCLSVCIILITYIIKKVYPFGGQTVLKVDLYHQYAPYIEELHSRILNAKSLLYSWEGGLGKDFVSQMAYYTTSPVNLLMFFFPEKNLPEMIALFILLKLSLSASTFTWYLKDHFKRNDLSILMFGMLYAFCAFLTCYYWNIMWLDTVALFPLVARGTERLVTSGKVKLYYVSLVLTMVVNFYLAVLVCVLTALYFLVLIFSNYSLPADIKAAARRFGQFALVSVLAAMTSMFILAPVALALAATAVSDSSFPAFEIYPNVWQLVTNHFLGARAAVLARNEDLPNIYSGVLTMVLLPLYYTNRHVKKEEKIGLSVMLVFMLLCACIRPLDYMIHGFHFPANLPHRYTFVYSFILLYMAYSAFIHLPEAKFRSAPVTCAAYAGIILLTQYVIVERVEDIDRVLSDTDVVVNLLLMAAYLVTLWFGSRRRRLFRQILFPVLLILVVGECSFTNITNLEDTGSREAYVKYMDDAAQAVAYIEDLEKENQSGEADRETGGEAWETNANDGFYRAEFRRFTTINDASLYHYNGFSQFSSLEPGGISKFMQNLGVAATGNSFRYYDPTPLVDSIFDVKYVMSKDEAHPKAERYEFLKQFGIIWVYRNRTALPLGFLTDPEILNWQTEDSQPFALQNDFIHKAAGVQGDMFTMIEPDQVETENMSITPLEEEGCFNYKVNHPANLLEEPSVSVTYTSDRDQYLYIYVDAANAKRFVYRTNTVNQDRELSAGRSMIDVGHVSAGEKIYVDFKLTKRGAFEKTYRESGTVSLYAASYEKAAFDEAFEVLNRQGMQITHFEDTKIEGYVQADRDSVLFTSIPYVRGWEIRLDGEKAEKVSIASDGVIGVMIPEGRHTISFSYHQRILLPALLISVLGVVLFWIYSRRREVRGSR